MSTFANVFAAFEDLTAVKYQRGKISVVYLDAEERAPSATLHEAISEVVEQIHSFFTPQDKLTIVAIRETVTDDMQGELIPAATPFVEGRG